MLFSQTASVVKQVARGIFPLKGIIAKIDNIEPMTCAATIISFDR